MSESATTRTLTVRLSPELYSAAQKVAHERRVSLNALMQSSLAETIQIAEERARYDAYTLLGSDKADCDVEYAIDAQSEVMLGEARG